MGHHRASNEYPQHMFLWRNKKTNNPKLSPNYSSLTNPQITMIFTVFYFEINAVSCLCMHTYFAICFLVFQWNLLLNLFCTFFYMYIYCRFSGFKFRNNTQWAISFSPLFMCTFLKLFMEHILQVGIAVAPSITDHLLPMFDDFLARYHQVSNVSFKK